MTLPIRSFRSSTKYDTEETLPKLERIRNNFGQALSPFFALFLVFIFSFLPGLYSYAEAAEPESYFYEGLILFRNGQYEQAKLKFILAVADPQQNRRITASYLMLAKTFLKIGDSGSANKYASLLVQDYPNSRYVGDALATLAESSYQSGDKNEALSQFLSAIEQKESKPLTSYCEKMANQIVDSGVSSGSLEKLLETKKSQVAQSWITLWLARTYYSMGQKDKADEIIDKFLKNKPDARFATAAQKMKLIPTGDLMSPVRIGIILPLNGYFSREAWDMLRGIAFAIKEQEHLEAQVELFVKDSRGTLVGTIDAAKSLFDLGVNLIIGELEGDKSTALAGLCSQANVPLIVPVATENGISSVGPAIFQANNNFETRGKAIADYAVNQLNLQTFATLAPADDYGHSLADAFANRVDSLRGTIIAQQWYYPGTNDFKRQFMAIREAGFRYALRDTLRSRGMATSQEAVQALFEKMDKKAVEKSEDKLGLIESTNIPVTAIDGIFLPIYDDEISLVAPQFALANINTQPLGGDNWLNEDALRRQRNYINGIVFISGHYISEIDPEFRNFQNKFRLATATSPGMMAIYGYDIMHVLALAIEAGNRQSEDIIHYLENMEKTKVLGGEIVFNKTEHVNDAVILLMFKDGNVNRIQ
jgi:branched-chain amino acid transport system substrate-binding protein